MNFRRVSGFFLCHFCLLKIWLFLNFSHFSGFFFFLWLNFGINFYFCAIFMFFLKPSYFYFTAIFKIFLIFRAIFLIFYSNLRNFSSIFVLKLILFYFCTIFNIWWLFYFSTIFQIFVVFLSLNFGGYKYFIFSSVLIFSGIFFVCEFFSSFC